MAAHDADTTETAPLGARAGSWFAGLTVCALAAAGTAFALGQAPASEPYSVVAPSASETPVAPIASETPIAPSATPAPTSPYDFSTDSSITVLVNKARPLQDLNYAPSDLVRMTSIGVPSMNDHSLRREAADAIKQMFQAAAKAGHDLDMTSGFRDRAVQQSLYDNYVGELGQEGADATSARPGYSEHQTGLAADISAAGEGCALEACFATTEAGKWLAENSWKYGFILRYPQGETPTTGYEFEPWHFRYIGPEAAKAYKESGAKTYEAFLQQPAAPDYVG